MIGRLVVAIGLMLVLQGAMTARATDQPALQIQPLQHVDQLAKGERKRGFVDITNVQAQAIDVELSVQGFRQTDNSGTLVFFDDERLSRGIQLDLYDARIPAHKTLRLYFVADSTRLPSGDVFAAIFARITGQAGKGSDTSVRLGSLLMLTNGSPGAREAKVSALTLPWFQAGSGIEGQVSITNTAASQTASGFFPEVAVQVWPFRPTTLHSPLVYAGNTRTVSFRMPGDYIGVYHVAASYQGHGVSRWVVAITGYWRWVAPIIVTILGGIVLWFLQRSKAHHRFAHKR